MTLVYLSFAFAVGILTGHVLRSEGLFGCSLPAWLFPAFNVLLVGLLLIFRHRSQLRLVAALTLFLMLGAWRYTTNPFVRCWTEHDLAFHQTEAGTWATIEGEVAGFPDVQDSGTRYQLAVERVVVNGREHQVRGLAMVEALRYPIYSYGDTLRASGLLLAPPVSDDFDYRRFLAIRNVHTLVRRPRIERIATSGGQPFWRALYRVRSRGVAIVNRVMSEPAAGLTGGMVLGIDGGISDEVNDAFKATGTSHLIVISGSNIALLAGALVAALGLVLTRRRAALVAAPLIMLYVLLVGADPPALRAGVMGLLALGALFFGRRGTAYVSLCAAGLAMLAVNPLTLWDIGFQLSFMTSLGLILFSRPLSRVVLAALRARFPDDLAKRWASVLEGTLIVTIAAQASVLPLILCYFGRLSPVSLIANTLVLPVQPAILGSGIAALLAGAVWQPLGQAVGALPWLLLSYTVGVVRAAAAIPFASLDTGRVGPLFVAGYYVVLVLVFASPRLARAATSHPHLRRGGVLTGLVSVLLCLAFCAWRARPDGLLHVIFVSGQDSEAAIIVAPSGRSAWLWDGRGDGEALVDSTRRGRWVRGKPDVVLCDCDVNPWPGSTCIALNMLAPRATVALTEDLHLVRLSTNGVPALLLAYDRFRTLLPVTLPLEAQVGLEPVSAVSVLKTAGPGTGVWPSVEYIAKAEPQLVLWPLETSYPPAVAEYLATRTTSRVEHQGSVEIVSDGQRFWVMRHSPLGPH